MREIRGKTAFVTGAASGIGKGIALALAEAGANVALADLDGVGAREAAEEVARHGVRTLAMPLDVSLRPEMRAAAARVEAELGRVHILCNNAGIGFAGRRIQDATEADWDWAVGVNLMGVVNGLLAFLPGIIGHGEGGHVVNTASMSGLRVNPDAAQALYVTTKFAVVGLSEAARVDLAPHGIGVSVLCPGFVRTAIYQAGRYRQARFGGPFEKPTDNPLAGAAALGIEPIVVGRLVVHAIENDVAHILTHPDMRDTVEARHAELMADFDLARQLKDEGVGR